MSRRKPPPHVAKGISPNDIKKCLRTDRRREPEVIEYLQSQTQLAPRDFGAIATPGHFLGKAAGGPTMGKRYDPGNGETTISPP